ncbi:MAG: ABC transporter permease [Peptoniphilaceae bacterium]|nr:ABC transporter permease [Peptoniphilaceae bacterium]MDD7433991.1 ABC transporter permease [Peptoniphilaceae bacterium]MDY3075605.1 ABC transporter permease [Peptoniphilaceae bacterium]
MKFQNYLQTEFLKTKRSKILPLLFLAPILVISSGISSLSRYFTPEYENAWQAMFVQSALLYAYYLLPLTMIVVCLMLQQRESGNFALRKMLSLPISRQKLSLAKLVVALMYLLAEVLIFFLLFVVVGLFYAKSAGITQSLPILYLVRRSLEIFLSMIPTLALIWLLMTLFEKPLLSVGLNFLCVLPAILVANTPLRFCYPYCYSGYLVSNELHLGAEGYSSGISWPFVLIAVFISAIAMSLSAELYGKTELSE